MIYLDPLNYLIAVYAFAGTLSLAFLRLLLDPYAAPDAPALEKVLGFPMAIFIPLYSILEFGVGKRAGSGKMKASAWPSRRANLSTLSLPDPNAGLRRFLYPI